MTRLTKTQITLFAKAIIWIAHNDNPEDRTPSVVAGYVSSVLVADLFDVSAIDVGMRVVKYRVDNDI